MAMVKCRECAGPMSDEAAACPSCGAPNRDQRKPLSSRWYVWVGGGVAVAFGGLLLIGATTPKYVTQAHLAREVCERDNAAFLLGNPNLCKEIEKGIIERKGCPVEAPNCSWGGK